MPPRLTITRSNPDSTAAIPLIDALSAELLRRFGRDGRNSFVDWTPEDPRSVFLLAMDRSEAVGCGAIRPIQGELDVAEVKRMYARRGRCGIGTLVLEALEREACRLGYTALWLETMSANAEAIAFYTRHGYRRRENYGRYVKQSLSICFEKSPIQYQSY
ncbi:ribosomal protein S18 acetylase RimI-like enzyme [Skermanella aerolata]|uniref:GNAT family N-acetyltransferase n=1 Tax=Skermanella aerolata TaxID=393310 RepID=UPI003D24FA11